MRLGLDNVDEREWHNNNVQNDAQNEKERGNVTKLIYLPVIPVPVVWSSLGPVNQVGVEPLARVQSKESV